MSLAGLKVAVDVQHIYRDGPHAKDRGAQYALDGGAKLWEADCARHYADALIAYLQAAGATTWTNDPIGARLVGPYERRQRTAMALGANLYLACHVNAGGGRYPMCMYTTPGSRPASLAIVAALGGLPELQLGRVVALGDTERGAVCVRQFTTGPGVLLEPLFGDYRGHQGLLNSAGLELVGRTIGSGVAAWWTATHGAV